MLVILPTPGVVMCEILNKCQILENNSVFVVKLIPSMKKISQNTIQTQFLKLYIRFVYTYRAYTRESAVHICKCAHNISDQYTQENTLKSHISVPDIQRHKGLANS